MTISLLPLIKVFFFFWSTDDKHIRKSKDITSSHNTNFEL